MSDPKYAPKTEDGNFLYVRSSRTIGGPAHESLVEEISAKEARAKFGWTRQYYTTITIRRATPDDVKRLRRDA